MTRRGRLLLLLTLGIAGFVRLTASNPLQERSLIELLVLTALNLGTLSILWLLAYRYLNMIAALMAGLMYALSPWAIFFSPSLTLTGVQFTLTAVVALAIVAFRENKGQVLLPGLVLILASAPLLRDFLALPIVRGTENALTYTVQAAAGIGLEQFIGGRAPVEILANVPRPGEVWMLVLGSTLLIGLPALWLRSKLMLTAALLWLGLPIIAYTLFTPSLSPALFVFSLPALCLLAGAGAAWLAALLPGKPYSRMIVLAAFAVVLLSQALWWRGLVRYLTSL